MKYPDITLGHVEAVWNKLGGEEGVEKFLRDELVVQPVIISKSSPETELDFLVRVDRSVRPTYPNLVKKVMHPELELGPAEYNLQTQVEEWLHDDQKSGVVKGQVIYDHLKKVSNELADQLGLADLLAIQAKGIEVFRKLYSGKAVFGWKSVVQDRDVHGFLFVPYLCDDGAGVVLRWGWLGNDWRSRDPALRFRK